jgi:excisionase family DNA binding protein
MSTETEHLIDIAGLAQRLGVSERFVRRLVEERRIPFFKIGSHVRFHLDDVEQWIGESGVEARRPVSRRSLSTSRS